MRFLESHNIIIFFYNMECLRKIKLGFLQELTLKKLLLPVCVIFAVKHQKTPRELGKYTPFF